MPRVWSGGHSGDSKARMGAAILNDPEVRSILGGEGLLIPKDTWFVAGLHTTTTDEVTLLDAEHLPASHQSDVEQLRKWLRSAGAIARRERAQGLGLLSDGHGLEGQIRHRSLDWSQVRPEWGLAGNAAFIAAPRNRTLHMDLGGRSFLHSYDHHSDADNSVLKLIMCAPMVVASWINLQCLGSTVNNPVFGSGNKTLHNVVGTFGVCFGNGGDLEPGLPLQSLHDGNHWVHEPLRLRVYLEAPRERIDAVLSKHPAIADLVRNGWVLISSIEEEGAAIYRRSKGGGWRLD